MNDILLNLTSPNFLMWRRLIYGALLQEKMYQAWIRRTKRLKDKSLNAVEEEEIRLKNMAGVRLVQYLLYRHWVLVELMKLRFDNHEPVVYSLIEFRYTRFCRRIVAPMSQSSMDPLKTVHGGCWQS
jgi:hypothetical protein